MEQRITVEQLVLVVQVAVGQEEQETQAMLLQELQTLEVVVAETLMAMQRLLVVPVS